MGSIAFFRHAQASFFSKDYDQLSEHGRRQSQLLGEHWNSQGTRFTEVIVGPCRRHRQTAEIALDAANLQADILELSELDEHQVDQLVIKHRDSLAAEFPEIAPLVHNLDNAAEKKNGPGIFSFCSKRLLSCGYRTK